MARSCWCFCIAQLLLVSTPSGAQTISTSTPLPPLQWINLTTILRGSPPPPLKDASIGYDDTSRSLLIFGGESEDGFVQSQTFLLNLDSLTWSTPSPPANLKSTPSARSAALGGGDFAASNRHGHVVIGGKGSNGTPLSDVWEYDYINQFWSQVDVSPVGPSARWGASGGIDIRTMPISDPIVPGPNNTFFLAGGFDGTTSTALSDVWSLRISGTLSSNLPDQVKASWDRHTIGNLPKKVNQASTVLSQQIISTGGCSTPSLSNSSCALADSYVINTQLDSAISPSACPVPRSSAVLAPNMNGHSSSFSSQVFLLLGTFNSSMWQDEDGLQKGEVDVLDIKTGSWSRVLPSGDPGSTGNPAFPSPREGAVSFSFSSALVGQSRSTASDTIIFGGRDATGTYLSEVWLLRAYNDSINQSNQKWTGFADGTLQTGVNANGAGVTMQYMTRCAVAAPSASAMSASPSSAPPASSAHLFDTSIAHKVLAPLSVALFLPATFLYRLVSTQGHPDHHSRQATFVVVIAALTAVIAYAVGIAGFALSFTSINTVPRSAKGPFSHNNSLKTTHGKAGLAVFVCYYGVLPLLFLFSSCRPSQQRSNDKSEPCAESHSHDPVEKAPPEGAQEPMATPTSAFPPTQFQFWKRWSGRQPREPSDTESVSSVDAGPVTSQRGFEVINRPARMRRISGNSQSNHFAAQPADSWHSRQHIRTLGDVDWLERRRSLNVVGELDYVITQANRLQATSTHATTDGLIGHLPSRSAPPETPRGFDIVLRLLFHSLTLGLSLLSLVALWSRAPKPVFVVFLLWTLAFYISICALAWHGKPQMSFLAAILFRLRVGPQLSTIHPLSASTPDPLLSSADSRGPYIHQPPYRTTPTGHDDSSVLHALRSEDTHDEDVDEDEDSRQRRIEEEMGRREVSIVTVPKRKLWIVNPT